MQISSGVIAGAEKVVIYGPEGIGKSTFAGYFPKPVFIDTEGSTKQMNVSRTPKPSSWAMLMEQVRYFKLNPYACDTLVIDTVDWAEQLCMVEICAKAQKASIEDFAYGKGYTYLAEEFGRLLNLLSELIELGINVVLVAHATMRKFEQPDELGAYDRWEMKLQKKVSPLVKEWADMVLFANYKTYVIDADGQGTGKGKNKAQGGQRVMRTTHHPCWDAKNRHDLPEELDFYYGEISGFITPQSGSNNTVAKQLTTPPVQSPEPIQEPAKEQEKEVDNSIKLTDVPQALAELMIENNVSVLDIQRVVAAKGYYPMDTPIDKYDSNFVTGVLVGAWPQVFDMIQKTRQEVA